MEQIKKRFYLSFILMPFISLILAKALYIFASITASDIYYTGSSSVIMRLIPHFCKYGYVIFDQLYLGASVAAIVYSITFFGKRTAFKAAFASIVIFLLTFVAELSYNVLRNSLSAAQLVAAALAMLSELLFFVAIIIAAGAFATVFLKKSFTSKRRDRLKRYSAYGATLIPIGASALIRIFDITFFNVIPFLREYDDIRANEVVDIVLDYAYCIGVHFLLALAMAFIALSIYKKLTGALKPKYTGVSK